ncbi:ComEC/Rec2 family competence protein [Lacinutrix himadriensis]|uniref:ComEC/Rec2 family competence protein n=1 Tax=Lacinutrix himadriensis TaxID=641549 RepID=UPI0006E3BD6D|nr:ComEC/Rec2 family competence protein [Lacinutrix himadriensis]
MKILNFTVIKLSACLIIGIVLAYYISIPVTDSLHSTLLLFLLLSISVFLSRKQFTKTIWFGVLACFTTISLGILSTNFHNQKNLKNHYSHWNSENKPITFRIKEILKPGNYNDKYVVDILKIDDKFVTGKALLNLKKDSLPKKLDIDAILITTEGFQEVTAALNPDQFDYKKYLEKQYIYHQIYASSSTLFRVSETIHTPIGYASLLRNTINSKLKKHPFKADELSIINALILGQRQNISKHIYTNYVNAGAIHILAVSGLHVGILLLLLNTVLKPLERIKKGKILKMIIILILLWCYALIAGASASIIRAATMFSIVAIGMHLKRPSNIYNTLAISVFFILLFKPLFLFDVGFQLSYMAVLAIVSIQPILYKIWKPRFWVTDKLWQITTVTIAAQFGVLPISLFYFHQFPGLFWLSNIVVIPLIGIILASGIIVIVLALLNALPQFIANSFGSIISLMNTFFEWIASKEQFLFQGIPFHILYVATSYLIIIALVRIYVKRNYTTLVYLCLAILSLQIAIIYTKYENSKDAFIVFHKSRNTVIGLKGNKTLQVFHNLDSITNNKTIGTFAVANFTEMIKEDTLRDLFLYRNHKILIVDSLGIYNLKSVQPDYVLLRNSPKINLERLIDSIQPKGIIADGSNYKSYVARWENTCKKRKLPFHQTGKKGAFILE